MKRLALLTSGGDAPGMNAAIAAFAQHAEEAGAQALGVRRGFAGLLERDCLPLEAGACLRWARSGGTWLQSARLEGFAGRLSALQGALDALEVGGLVVLGGNGSLAGAALLAKGGSSQRCVVGIPATIDNDVAASDESLGFDTAANTALRLLDAIRDTAESLPRFFALETLGGDTGFLARYVAEAGAAEVALLPERQLPERVVQRRLREAIARQGFALLVASEGYPDLEGVLARAAAALGTRLRLTRVGHAQRGGSPSARDRVLASRLSAVAVEALLSGISGVAAVRGGRTLLLPFTDTAERKALAKDAAP